MKGEEDEARDRRKTRHIDTPLGEKLRLERDARRLTREEVATRLGVSGSTIQKYEDGSTRISAARLWQLCRLLGVDVATLFADLPHHPMLEGTGVAEPASPYDQDDGRARRITALARAAGKLTDDRLEIAETLVKAMRPRFR